MSTKSPSKGKKFSKKRLINWLHLWPGMISAVIVLLICLSGTILVFSDEIIALSAGKARYVEKVLPQRIPTEKLIGIAVNAIPGAKTTSYMVEDKRPERSVRFNVFSPQKGLFMVYVDQYSGKVLKVDKTIFFFYVTAHFHESLLLGKTGQWIVDIATIIFLLEIITGIILWWPKKWNKSAISVKWNAPWKRLSFDMHRILGLYAFMILLVLITTGLLIAFEPLAKLTLKSFGGEDTHHWEHAISAEFDSSTAKTGIDEAVKKTFGLFPEKKEIKIALWEYEASPYFLVAATNRAALKSTESPDLVYINRQTGVVNEHVPETILRGEKIENMIWMLHMGNWMGWLGKIITCLGGLIGCLLPITGFYIWWNKKPKKRKYTSTINSDADKL